MSLSSGQNYPNLIEFIPSPYSEQSRSFLKISPFKERGGGIFNNEINLKINKYMRKQNILPSIPNEILLDAMRKKQLIAERKERDPTEGGKKRNK